MTFFVYNSSMGKKIKIAISDVERLYPYFCTELQIYVNYHLKHVNRDSVYVHIEQDFIDYAYIVGNTPSHLKPVFSKTFPPSRKPNFFTRIWLMISLFKYRRFLNNKLDASLLRIGETMIIQNHGCCRGMPVKRTEDGLQSLWDDNMTWDEDGITKLSGVRMKTFDTLTYRVDENI